MILQWKVSQLVYVAISIHLLHDRYSLSQRRFIISDMDVEGIISKTKHVIELHPSLCWEHSRVQLSAVSQIYTLLPTTAKLDGCVRWAVLAGPHFLPLSPDPMKKEVWPSANFLTWCEVTSLKIQFWVMLKIPFLFPSSSVWYHQ